jgi:hypothetical protein
MEIRVRSTGAVMYESEWKTYMKQTTGKNFGRLDEATLDTYGSDIVFEGPQATGGTVYQYSQRSGVEQIEGKWYSKYILGPVFTDTTEDGVTTTAAENEAAYKARKDAEQATSVRATRDTKLAESDWTQARDVILANDADWQTYRQALRDVPTQEGFPWSVTWPEQP